VWNTQGHGLCIQQSGEERQPRKGMRFLVSMATIWRASRAQHQYGFGDRQLHRELQEVWLYWVLDHKCGLPQDPVPWTKCLDGPPSPSSRLKEVHSSCIQMIWCNSY
jgi:hypothetical protein